MSHLELFSRLAVALAVGLLIGLERGHFERTEPKTIGRRITGMRTFGLIALVGALCALIAEEIHLLFLGIGFLGFAALMTAFHVLASGEDHDYGITTIIASLITFALGALAMIGYMNVAAATAVVMTMLLGMKPILHRIEVKLQHIELEATLKLLLISIVILPVLPNEGYGPWKALNPYTIWWMVVLIASISYVGYFGTKIIGAKKGLLLTGLFGGLASSTAVTVNFSRSGRKSGKLIPLFSAGILVAAGLMYPRILIVATIISPPLALNMVIPLVAMALVCFLAAAWLARVEVSTVVDREQTLRNPFEMKVALQLAGVLAAIMFLAHALQQWLGDLGLFILAALSGISDVDAINLTLAGMASDQQITMAVAANAIIVAAVTNTITKGVLAAVIGGKRLCLYVSTTLLLAVVVGVATIVLFS